MKFRIACIVALAASCSPAPIGEALRPDAPTATEALGEKVDCTAISERPEPFLVDWKPEDRGKLQRALQSGVAVVGYDCNGLRILTDCKLEGDYAFAQIAKEGPHALALDRNSDLAATIPLSVATIGAEVRRGMKLDLSYVLVGARTTVRSQATRPELVGRCDGATHFVRAVWLGAFEFGTSTAGSASAHASALGASVDAGDASAKKIGNRAGDLAACDRSADAKFTDGPPLACEAPVRLELVALQDVAEAPPGGGALAAPPAPSSCSAGFVQDASGVCKRAEVAKAYVCDLGDRRRAPAPTAVAACEEQCALGSAESCYNGGVSQTFKGTAEERLATDKKSLALLDRGCALGYLPSCVLTGLKLRRPGPLQDVKRAEDTLRRACEGGSGHACRELASMTKDPLQSTLLVKRSCDLGHGWGCYVLAQSYAAGVGVTASPALALDALTRSCSGGDTHNCFELAQTYRRGDLGKRDVDAAVTLLRRNCVEKKDAGACEVLGRMYRTGDGVAKSADKARELLEPACAARMSEMKWGGPACSELGLLHQTGDGVAQDELKAVELYQRSCKPDTDVAEVNCIYLAELFDKGGSMVKQDLAKAARMYGRTCRAAPNPSTERGVRERACVRATELYKAQKDLAHAGESAHYGCDNYRLADLCTLAKSLPRPAAKP